MICRHKRAGIVTNQPDGYDPTRPHAAESVCAREACILAAIYRVAGLTNSVAVYVSDADRLPPQKETA